jgi:hypothetical protein
MKLFETKISSSFLRSGRCYAPRLTQLLILGSGRCFAAKAANRSPNEFSVLDDQSIQTSSQRGLGVVLTALPSPDSGRYLEQYLKLDSGRYLEQYLKLDSGRCLEQYLKLDSGRCLEPWFLRQTVRSRVRRRGSPDRSRCLPFLFLFFENLILKLN